MSSELTQCRIAAESLVPCDKLGHRLQSFEDRVGKVGFERVLALVDRGPLIAVVYLSPWTGDCGLVLAYCPWCGVRIDDHANRLWPATTPAPEKKPEETTEALLARLDREKKQSLTDDPNDPALGRGVDTEPTKQHSKYLVLSDEERAKGFIRPVRRSYVHKKCGSLTTMSQEIAETYARSPLFYGATYCVHCQMHLPVSEFTWDADGTTVGT